MTINSKKLTLQDLKSEFGKTTFANALKSERQSREMPRSEFSRLLGITISSLADLEHGRRIPSPERAQQIAQKLKDIESFWIELAVQDQLEKLEGDFKVSIASA